MKYRMKQIKFAVFLLITACFTLRPFDADAAEAPKASTTCAGCHGPEGVSANDPWPNLAGQKESYLVQQLKAFKNGDRLNALMSPIAKMLTDGEIKELAAYYSALNPNPKVSP